MDIICCNVMHVICCNVLHVICCNALHVALGCMRRRSTGLARGGTHPRAAYSAGSAGMALTPSRCPREPAQWCGRGLALVGAAGCCTLCNGVWYGAVCLACSSAASCAGWLRADAQQHGLRCPPGFVHRTTMDEVTMSAWPRSLGCRTLSCAVPHMRWVRTRKALNHADRRKWACRKTRGSLRCTAS